MAQSVRNSGSLGAVADAAVEIRVEGLPNIGVQLTGTFTATVHFKGTIDGSTWADVGVALLADPTTIVTSATAVGAWQCTAHALVAFQVICTAYTSGTINVALIAGE